MTRLALAALFLMAIVRSPAHGAEAPRKMNVVFILADDLGWRDLGCYGSTFHETPNLDALAARGMRFTNAYAACNVCSPTRASIMTGRYPARLHLTDWLPGRPNMPSQKMNRPVIAEHLSPQEVTLAQAFKEGGYATAFLGKWHLGGPEYYPDKMGFDLNVGGCDLGHPPSYFSPYRIPTLTDGPAREYLTDRLTDEAVKFIRSHADKPFFLYLAHYAVHNPQQAKPQIADKFKAKVAASPPAGAAFAMDLGRKVRQVQDQPIYAAMVQSLDESVGRVMAALRDAGQEQNTIVVFTSDNGGLSTAEGTPTSNVPLRMGKGWNYEGGIREPLLILWPGVTTAGAACDDPVISTDFYPTLMEAVGLPARPAQHLDGLSLASVLKGNHLPDRPIFWHYPHYSNQGGGPSGAVRLGSYKLIEWFEDERAELFDLEKDLGEKNDLSKAMPEKVKELTHLLHHWRKTVGAQMPSVNPDYDPAWKPPAGGGKKAAAMVRRVSGLGPLDDD